MHIAASGYQQFQDYAFFPLYPLFIKLLNIIFNNPVFSGIVISNISFLLFLFFLHRYVKTKFSDSIAKNTVLTYLFFPTAFYTTIVYSESLFLLFLILFFLFLENKKYSQMIVFAMFAQLTRFIGIFLVISAFIKIVKNQKLEKDLIFVPLSALGTLIYSAFQWQKEGDALAFVKAQAFWLRFPQDPVSTIFSYLWNIFNFKLLPTMDYLDLTVTLVFIGLLIANIRKIKGSLWAFSIIVLLIPSSTGTLTSMPRYVLASLGTFIIIGKILSEKPYLKIPIWTIMLFAQIILFAFFINGYWIS